MSNLDQNTSPLRKSDNDIFDNTTQKLNTVKKVLLEKMHELIGGPGKPGDGPRPPPQKTAEWIAQFENCQQYKDHVMAANGSIAGILMCKACDRRKYVRPSSYTSI